MHWCQSRTDGVRHLSWWFKQQTARADYLQEGHGIYRNVGAGLSPQRFGENTSGTAGPTAVAARVLDRWSAKRPTLATTFRKRDRSVRVRMRVLILGGGGMLGHKLVQVCRSRFDTWTTVRSVYRDYEHYGFYTPDRTLGGVEACRFDTVVKAFAIARPDAVVNAVGVIKQLPGAKDPVLSLTVNSLFPHQLAALCRVAGARLIHISTDCVFSGLRGRYTERDPSDAEDLYGRSKYLGEVGDSGCVTFRTSMIGRELRTAAGLVEWFLSQRGGQVAGYRRAWFSGLTTLSFAGIVATTLEREDLVGVYHAAGDPISKFDLLSLLNVVFETHVVIEPDFALSVDRTLDASRLRAAIGFHAPAWPTMVEELASDDTPYDRWRAAHGT